MTIAACYLSTEGVVFGADSTTTMYVQGLAPGAVVGQHHYDFAQKIYQVGEDSSLALAMWGLGSVGRTSFRTLVAKFADTLAAHGAASVQDVANSWSRFFYSAYSTELGQQIARAHALEALAQRTAQVETELSLLQQAYSGGFCLGGHLPNDRTPNAFEIRYSPTMSAPAQANMLPLGSARFWGCPNLIDRLRLGLDKSLLEDVLASGKWTGTPEDLFRLIAPYCLGQPFDLPIREAIDWIHASIYTTIKTMKFSHLDPVCGGRVEIAVITTDRRFRWVRHKGFDAAIGDGGAANV